MNSSDIFRGYGIKIILKESDDFLKVKETLTRIGTVLDTEKTLCQTCHILHKQGEYAIIHFNELFALDNLSLDETPLPIDEEDIAKRNTISNLLETWGLLELVDPSESDSPTMLLRDGIKILSHKDKHNWCLVSEYEIGEPKY